MVVACSGGADSAAALLLARRVAPQAKLIACYVDHGIRPRLSIARDRAAVRAQAAAAGAAVSVRRVLVGPKTDGSPEERARVARYRALAAAAQQSGAPFVITGHHQNDLVETSLLALVRGSGIDGVAAMRPLRSLADGVTLVRPLLWATKAQCSELLHRLRIPTSEDETNADTHIPRNAVRLLVSGLEQALPGASRGVARSAALLADDKALLDRMTAAACQRARRGDSNDISAAVLRRMPIALVRRVIRYALAQRGLSLRDFSFDHCNAIATAIKEKRGGSFHAGAASVVLSAGKLTLQTASTARKGFAPVSIVLDGLPCNVNTPFGCVSLGIRQARARKSGPLQLLDLAALQAVGSLEIRQPRQGDACIPSGRSRPISLARFLGKSGIPRSGRQAVSLLCAGGRIAAVLGLRVMEPFKPKGHGPVLEVGWRATDI
ncbi:MAG TPA: tRNA lysidine(34) synthetase TilS [Candidatus Eremiobacteraceae bacterium]|nr:tRNA lysidine(34) synthetase TilS [Candidatus Eremiobacteraceae bacterium]